MVKYRSLDNNKVLHIANKNALGGGIGTVIDYLREGIEKSEDFISDTVFTTYDHENRRPGKITYNSGNSSNEEISHEDLENIISRYDVVHIHGIPNYGVIENLEKIKSSSRKKPKIVNTAHSSVKQEFVAQYESAKNSKDKESKNDFRALKYFKDNDILNNPARFCDTYWGSAIYRQEKIMSLADSVQHMNEAYKSDIINEFSAHENSHKHHVIPNGVKGTDSFEERPKKKRILYVGRFATDKGIDELTDSLPFLFEKHPDAEVKIVGGDPEGTTLNKYKKKVEKAIKDYFKEKPDHNVKDYLSRVKFTGWVTDKEELRRHYNWTDYLIIPSRAESFSLTASEALMHKRIPIMTKTKALDDLYISKGIAFGIDPDKRHGKGIAETLSEILDNHDSKEHDEMAEKGRKFAMENYSFEKMIENQLNSYRKLISNKEKWKKDGN